MPRHGEYRSSGKTLFTQLSPKTDTLRSIKIEALVDFNWLDRRPISTHLRIVIVAVSSRGIGSAVFENCPRPPCLDIEPHAPTKLTASAINTVILSPGLRTSSFDNSRNCVLYFI
jgi:hypothetical protein